MNVALTSPVSPHRHDSTSCVSSAMFSVLQRSQSTQSTFGSFNCYQSQSLFRLVNYLYFVNGQKLFLLRRGNIPMLLETIFALQWSTASQKSHFFLDFDCNLHSRENTNELFIQRTNQWNCIKVYLTDLHHGHHLLVLLLAQFPQNLQQRSIVKLISLFVSISVLFYDRIIERLKWILEEFLSSHYNIDSNEFLWKQEL